MKRICWPLDAKEILLIPLPNHNHPSCTEATWSNARRVACGWIHHNSFSTGELRPSTPPKECRDGKTGRSSESWLGDVNPPSPLAPLLHQRCAFRFRVLARSNESCLVNLGKINNCVCRLKLCQFLVMCSIPTWTMRRRRLSTQHGPAFPTPGRPRVVVCTTFYPRRSFLLKGRVQDCRFYVCRRKM
jgi:hypothetical protein